MGEFDDLEEFLREHRIAFDRFSEGKYEYDPERVTYRPDQGVEKCLTTESGNPIVEVASLQPVLQALDALDERLRQGKISKSGVLRASSGCESCSARNCRPSRRHWNPLPLRRTTNHGQQLLTVFGEPWTG